MEGICDTCSENRNCGLGNDEKRQPILFCEEFSTTGAQSTPPSETWKQDWSADVAVGLCGNCENRATCKLCRTPGGVWFCEEYC